MKSRNAIAITVIILVSLSVLLSGCTGEKNTDSLTTPELNRKIDLSKIEIYPGEGEYLSSGPYNKIYIFGGNKETSYTDARILLLNYSLNYITLQQEDICPDSENPGNSGIVMRGTLKNEYDRDYWIIIGAAAYDSNGNLIGRTLDSGPICGMIARHIKSNKTENIELHFKHNNTISKINLSGAIGDRAPP
ncbi:MAG TPA: hypothetical protein VIO58_07565 [Candidatus Methanoperedens sp.]